MKRFEQPGWTQRDRSYEPWTVSEVARGVDICVFPSVHVPEAGGEPKGRHGLRGYLAGAEVDG